MDCLIIGGGAAGLNAALMCRQCWPEKSVTLIEAESETGYYRTVLPQFMVGSLEEDKLFFWRPGEDPFFQVRSGTKVESLDRANQILHLQNKENLRYDRLVLAPGGRATIPPVCADNSCQGMFPIRTLTIARKIRAWLPAHQKVAVLGGGLVGVKTAIFLRDSGLSVSLIQRRHLLAQLLSPRASKPLENHLRRMGINIFMGSVMEDIHSEGGLIKAVRVGGQWVPCDSLMVAVGSTPDVGFLGDSGLMENGGLTVSPALQTRDEKIYAAGDAVTISNSRGEKFALWTWPQAVLQGKLAGANLYRSMPDTLAVMSRPNAMNLHGLSGVILGAPVPGAEVVCYTRPSEGVYRELFIKEGRIVGGALVGDISGAGPLHAAMTAGKKMDERLYDLLQPGGKALSRFAGNYFAQQRQARFLLHQESKT